MKKKRKPRNTHKTIIQKDTDLTSSLDTLTLTPPESGEESDGGEWITPSNIKEIRTSTVERKGIRVPDVACITSDFAMQNVMLQMKMRLLSTDGVIIDQIKSFILRCHVSCIIHSLTLRLVIM